MNHVSQNAGGGGGAGCVCVGDCSCIQTAKVWVSLVPRQRLGPFCLVGHVLPHH